MLPVERLKSIPLFGELEDEQAAHVAPLFHRTRCKQGEILSRQGEPGNAFYVLDGGTLRIRHIDESEQDQLLGVLNAPAYFGETSLITGLPRDVTIEVSSKQADLFVLDKTEFDALVDQYPGIRGKLVVREQVEALLSQQRYPWLQPGEILYVRTRRHWFALVSRLILPVLVSAVLVIASVAAYVFLTPIIGNPLVSIALLVLALVCVLGSGGWNLLDWSNDYYIVTNKRVIHVEQVVFLLDEREEAPIEMITNVIEQSNGLAARTFGFTEIRIETSGRDVDINFTYSPVSKGIAQHIFEQMDRARDRAARQQQERLSSEIRSDLLERLAPEQAERLSAQSTSEPEAPLQMTIRTSHKTGLGTRLNALFGLTVETASHVTWRKHWFVLVKQIAQPLVAVLLVLGIGISHITGLVPLRIFGPTLDSTQILGLLGAWTILVLLACFWLWYQYEDWSNDIYRVTNDRVIDLEKSPFGLKKSSIETTLDRVQDVSYSQRSPLAVLFNYGDLTIETAGAGRFTFYGVQDPRRAMQEIFRRRDAHRSVQFDRQAKHDRKEFLDWFAEYHRFREDSGKSDSPIAEPEEMQDNDPAEEQREEQGDS